MDKRNLLIIFLIAITGYGVVSMASQVYTQAETIQFVAELKELPQDECQCDITVRYYSEPNGDLVDDMARWANVDLVRESLPSVYCGIDTSFTRTSPEIHAEYRIVCGE